MRCSEFVEQVIELSADRIQDRECADELRRHARHCPACASRLAADTELSHRLRQWAAISKSLAPPQSMEAEILNIFRSRSSRRVGRVARTKRWMAAAAVLFVGAFVAWELRLGSSGVGPRGDRADGPSARGSIPGHARQVSTPDPRVIESEGGPELYSPEERSTDFILLGGCCGIDCLEGGQLVRVRLPRQSMSMMGLSFDGAEAGEAVLADVVIGENGVTKAIRFVDIEWRLAK